MVSKVNPFLFMKNCVISVVYVNNFLLWARSKYDIDTVMNYFKEGGLSYNWENYKGESVSEFLVIDIKLLHDGGFQFYKTGLML